MSSTPRALARVFFATHCGGALAERGGSTSRACASRPVVLRLCRTRMLSGLDFEDSEQSTVHAYSEAAGSDDDEEVDLALELSKLGGGGEADDDDGGGDGEEEGKENRDSEARARAAVAALRRGRRLYEAAELPAPPKAKRPRP